MPRASKTVTADGVRIGEAAKLADTTPRTIRYYEEVGLLPEPHGRIEGSHRLYTEDDVEQLKGVLRLKRLLGLSLEELREVVHIEAARADLRERYHQETDPAELRQIVNEALGFIERQLELVNRRRAEIDQLDAELTEKLHRGEARLRELQE